MAAEVRLPVAVLISGGGTNLQALIDACAAPDFPAEIVLVLSNKADAYGLERARRAGIATAVVDHRAHAGRSDFEAAMQARLADSGAAALCLAGFMRVLSPDFVARWRDRILNIHPSLLPAYKGLDTHARALADGATVHGCSVHIVRPALDDGPIVAQAEVPVRPDDDAGALAARVLTREHVLYPLALRLLGSGRLSVAGEHAAIDGQAGYLRLACDAEQPVFVPAPVA